MSTILDVKNLETCFKLRRGILHAVNGVSFQLRKGEMLGIVGESGCGKSVTMLSLIRLLPPSAKVSNGSVLLHGKDLLQLNLKKLRSVRGAKIGMIFQDPMTSLNPVVKIGVQMAEPLIYHRGKSMNEALKMSADILELVGISGSAEKLNEYPHQLSGGMRQRVMIAMSLVCEPEIVIADEPTTALDVTIQAQIVELVKDLREKLKTSFIWITHDLGLISGMVDRICVMYAGYIIEEALVDDIYYDPRHPYTLALLGCIPKKTDIKSKRLTCINGSPPDLAHKPTCCPFISRCEYSIERCRMENPQLKPPPGTDLDSQHRVACWVDIKEKA